MSPDTHIPEEHPAMTRDPTRESFTRDPAYQSPRDPWAHRALTMRCATCMWYVPKRPSEDRVGDHPADGFGRCRKRAPTLSGYPAVFSTDWCGDHKLDEGKLP